MPKSGIYISQPEKVLRQAQQYSKIINQSVLMPVDPIKSLDVKELANNHINNIQYTIQRAKYQNFIFKKIQKIDSQKRKKISQSIQNKQKKAQQMKKKNIQKQIKKYQSFTKHITEVQKKHQQEEKKTFLGQKQQALKLRKELQQFYQKQQIKRKLKDQNQVKVATCYNDALQKIHNIQKVNQEVSKQAQIYLYKTFSRFQRTRIKSQRKMRNTSFDSKKLQEKYRASQTIQAEKNQKYIQKCGQNQNSSIKAFLHKQKQNQKSQKRINEFFKKKLQHWKIQKSRIDGQKQMIPQKCIQKVEKSLQSTFRNTQSTFKDSFRTWRETSILNKEQIKDKDDKKKDKIMGLHNDLTLRIRSSRQINQRMMSMKHRANKVAVAYS